MPLHVLLADDSVPAQNMGKKILADAGYDVLTVSNGLEALRKIAEHAPDIAILDIFMPGYTGLEICERLRASAATAALPVILTVGKLEPYRPEDGEHVHSNAVIVKPFAAAELVSAVRSLIGTEAPHLPVDSLNPDAHPLEGSAAAGVISAADPAATPERVEALREEAADEPLFSYGPPDASSSSDAAEKTLWSPQEPSVYADAPIPSGVDSNGAESLKFNPDAKSSPFSASVLDDLLPSTSRYPTEGGTSSFTEFNLEPEPSAYSSELNPRGSTAEEPLASAAEMAGPEPEVVMPDSAIAPEEILSGSGAPRESASGMDIPVLDPLLEVREAASSMASVVSTESVEPLEASAPEIASAHSEAAPGPSAGQLSQEEEARRLAFEALFNSDEPIPLDDFSASPPESAEVLPSNIAESANDHPGVFAPDFEIEPLNDDRQPEFTVPETDPHRLMEAKLDEAEPMRAIEMISERDPLLEDALEETNLLEVEYAPEPEIAAAAQIAETAPETAQAAEIEPHEVEAIPEQVEAAPEQAEVRQIVPEAATSETEPATLEAVYSAPELLEAAPEPEIAAAAQLAETAQAAEIEPHEVEVIPEQVEAAPEQAEVEQIVPEAMSTLEAPEPVQPQPEMHVAEISSSPEPSLGPDEAERVSQAVDRVFDRFKRLLVKAIVRELARPD